MVMSHQKEDQRIGTPILPLSNSTKTEEWRQSHTHFDIEYYNIPATEWCCKSGRHSWVVRKVDTVLLQNRISVSVTMVGLQARQLKLIPRDSIDELIDYLKIESVSQ